MHKWQRLKDALEPGPACSDEPPLQPPRNTHLAQLVSRRIQHRRQRQRVPRLLPAVAASARRLQLIRVLQLRLLALLHPLLLLQPGQRTQQQAQHAAEHFAHLLAHMLACQQRAEALPQLSCVWAGG